MHQRKKTDTRGKVRRVTERDYERIGNRIKRLATRYMYLNRNVDPRELESEGWMEAMIALRNPRRAAARDPFGYATSAACRAMIRYAQRQKTLVSVPMRPRNSHQEFVASSDIIWLDDEAAVGTPSELRGGQDAAGNAVVIRRVREVIANDEDGALVGLVLLDGWSCAAVSRMHGKPVRDLQHAVRRVEETIRLDAQLAACAS